MRKHAVLAAFLLLLSTSAAAQSGFASELKELRVGENDTVNVTVQNRLSIDDTLTVQFGGEALTSGLISLDYPASHTCDSGGRWCRLTVPAESERSLLIGISATGMGQAPLEAVVNSSTSHLANEDDIEIRVQPNFAPVTVSAPGIQLVHLLLLGLAGALAFRWKEGI